MASSMRGVRAAAVKLAVGCGWAVFAMIVWGSVWHEAFRASLICPPGSTPQIDLWATPTHCVPFGDEPQRGQLDYLEPLDVFLAGVFFALSALLVSAWVISTLTDLGFRRAILTTIAVAAAPLGVLTALADVQLGPEAPFPF